MTSVFRIRNKETGEFEKDSDDKSIFENYNDVAEIEEQDEYEIVEFILAEKNKFLLVEKEKYEKLERVFHYVNSIGPKLNIYDKV